jgi:3-methyl-2-oxobutanoate hydroxymethyltransferase
MNAKPAQRRKMTIPRFVAARSNGTRLSMLTAYDFLTAQIFDEAGIDSILVGDSLGMVVQGKSTTMPVTLDEMIYHGEIVCRAVKYALVVVDMPFMSYQVSAEQAVRNAGRILKETGADAVKLEGGEVQAETITAISRADIPVMAHIGMRPQSVRMLGGMGRIQRDEKKLLHDAKVAQDAGAFSVLIELVPRSLAANVTAMLDVPTIGIGAGPECDGQVLVSTDMLGMSGFEPKFLKKYADIRATMHDAVQGYANDVREGVFPADEHSHA